MMFIVYTKYFEIDIIFYWTKSLRDMNSDLISVFVNIQHMKYLLARLRILKNDTKALIQCAFEKQIIIIFELKSTIIM